jgi:hypothetical protein
MTVAYKAKLDCGPALKPMKAEIKIPYDNNPPIPCPVKDLLFLC